MFETGLRMLGLAWLGVTLLIEPAPGVHGSAAAAQDAAALSAAPSGRSDGAGDPESVRRESVEPEPASTVSGTLIADLSEYLSIPVTPGAEATAADALARGQAAARARNLAAALAAYDEAAAVAPQFADWISLLAAMAAAEAGDTAVTIARLAMTPAELAERWGWRARVLAYTRAGDLPNAVRVAEEAAARLPTATLRAEAWAAAGTARYEQGDVDGARTAWRRAMEIAPSSTAAVDAARGMSNLPGLSPEDALLVGQTYLRHGNTSRGVAGIDAYLDAGRGTPAERVALRLEAGRALFQGGQYAEAERRLSALASEPVGEAVAAEALFLTARSRYRAGRIDQGLATFRQVIERYPAQPFAAEAAYILADLEQDEDHFDEARRLFRQAMTLQPTALEAGLAAMRLGGLAYLDGDYEGALRIYEDYRARFPSGRRIQQATYWAGRIYQRLGRDSLARERFEQARQLDPFSYYGVRAAELLGRPKLQIALGPEPGATAEPRAEAQVALFRLRLLSGVTLPGATSFELERLRSYFDTKPNGWYALAEALNEGGFAYDGILLARDIQRREGQLNPRLLRLIYPFPYRDLIEPEARRLGVDPFLAAGMIRQESMFNPRAVSPAGAIGLMQVMPATGETLARQIGIADFDPQRDLMNPEINVRLGMRYLATRLGDYDGDVVSALAAYNAGAHRVERWALFPEYRAGDPELFAERIPFTETRDYVKIVQANAEIYRALYGD